MGCHFDRDCCAWSTHLFLHEVIMSDITIPGTPKEEVKEVPKENPPVTPVAVPPANDQVLIVNTDRRKGRMNVKLRKRVNRGYSPNEYMKVLNPKDYNDLALLFEDLDFIIGAPVEKAYRKYKQNKGDGFPFF